MMTQASDCKSNNTKLPPIQSSYLYFTLARCMFQELHIGNSHSRHAAGMTCLYFHGQLPLKLGIPVRREVVERRAHIVTGKKPTEAEIDNMIDTGESETIFQKAILEQGRGHVSLLAISCCAASVCLSVSVSVCVCVCVCLCVCVCVCCNCASAHAAAAAAVLIHLYLKRCMASTFT